jgi:hypothetical protein
VRVRERAADLDQLGFALVAVGFSPPEALATLARHLAWPDPFCSDEERLLYQRLGLGRAASGQVFTPGTRAVYAAAAARGETVERPVEDLRQLGGDALAVGGVARVVFRPASPDDRPDVDELVAAASSLA